MLDQELSYELLARMYIMIMKEEGKLDLTKGIL